MHSDALADTLSAEYLLGLMMLANAYGVSRLEQMCARRLITRMDADNVHEVAGDGADSYVSGSGVFKSKQFPGDYAGAIAALRDWSLPDPDQSDDSTS